MVLRGLVGCGVTIPSFNILQSSSIQSNRGNTVSSKPTAQRAWIWESGNVVSKANHTYLLRMSIGSWDKDGFVKLKIGGGEQGCTVYI